MEYTVQWRPVMSIVHSRMHQVVLDDGAAGETSRRTRCCLLCVAAGL